MISRLQKFRVLSVLNNVLLLAAISAAGLTGKLVYLILAMPVIWTIAIYLNFQKCPRCGKKFMKRQQSSGFEPRVYNVFPKRCDQCGYPSNEISVDLKGES